jgi:hypothetical protein
MMGVFMGSLLKATPHLAMVFLAETAVGFLGSENILPVVDVEDRFDFFSEYAKKFCEMFERYRCVKSVALVLCFEVSDVHDRVQLHSQMVNQICKHIW